jgi:hypothetical protein
MRIDGQAARVTTSQRGMICWFVAIHSPGVYRVQLLLLKDENSTLPSFVLHVGRFRAARQRAGFALRPIAARHGTMGAAGIVRLEPAARGLTEMCLAVLQGNSSRPGNTTGKAVTAQVAPSRSDPSFDMVLRGLRFVLAFNQTLGNGTNTTAAADMEEDAFISASGAWQDVPAGMPSDLLQFSLAEPAAYQHLQPTPAMQNLERRIRAAEVAAAWKMDPTGGGLARSGCASSGNSRVTPKTPTKLWNQLQQRYGWADEQGRFESLFKPCKIHGLPQCAEDCD